MEDGESESKGPPVHSTGNTCVDLAKACESVGMIYNTLHGNNLCPKHITALSGVS